MEIMLGTFIKKFTGVLLVNERYTATAKELKEVIDNRVVDIQYNIKNKGWIIKLDECVVDNTNVLEIRAL